MFLLNFRKHSLPAFDPETCAAFIVALFLFCLCLPQAVMAVTGDIDQSGRVDGSDLMILSKAKNTSAGDPGFVPEADLNNDGKIDDADLQILSERFGFSGRDFSVWVADTNKGRVVKLFHETGEESLEKTGLSFPIGISVNNSDGSVWVAESNNNRVLKLSGTGTQLLAITGFSNPQALSVNPQDGSCWVANKGADNVVKILPDIPDGYDIGVDTRHHLIVYGLNDPESVSVDHIQNQCWIADTNNNRIVKIDDTLPSDYDVANPPEFPQYHVLASGFSYPKSVSANPADGSCWVADYYNDQIVKLSHTGTTELFRADGFSSPMSVSVNPTDGSCWIADTENNQVVRFSSEGVELLRLGGFSLPYSVSVNPFDGSCWIVDTYQQDMVKLLVGGTELLRIPNFIYPKGVSVFFGNQIEGEPEAFATITPESAGVGEIIEFAGSGTDSDGQIVLYEWDFEGDGTFDWSSETTGETTHQYDNQGIYNPVLKVTDDSSLFAFYYATALKIGQLTATASASVQSGPAPLNVGFNAVFFDPNDAKIESYSWDFDGDGHYEYYSETTGNTSHLYTAQGTYDAVLKITDTGNIAALDSITIKVLSSPPTLQASAVPDTGSPPLTVVFSGTAEDDGQILLYEWDFDGDGDYEWASTQNGDVSHTYRTRGTYEAAFRATDNDSLSAIGKVLVVVNLVPTVSIHVTPSKGKLPLQASFSCTAKDSDGTIALYEWDFNGDHVFDLSGPNETQAETEYSVPGVYEAMLRVTDNDGAVAEDTTTIHVLETGNPIATASVVPSSGAIPLTCALNGSGIDEDGQIVRYQWSFGDEPGDPFFDDMENGIGEWVSDAQWAQTNSIFHTADTSWTDSPSGNSTPNADTSLVSRSFDLSANKNPRLIFFHIHEFAYNTNGIVEISPDDGSSWSELETYINDKNAWEKVEIDLSDYTGNEHVKIRFRLQTSTSTEDGWYIDDVYIEGLTSISWDSALTGDTEHTYATAGTFNAFFKATDDEGNFDTSLVEIEVLPGTPEASFEASPDHGLVPFDIELDGASSTDANGTIESYDWFLTRSQIFRLNEQGYPTTQLFIGLWDSGGCKDIDSHQEGIENSSPAEGEAYGDRTWFQYSDPDGTFDWEEVFGNVYYDYGYSYINMYSPVNQDVYIWFGSEGSARFWINGAMTNTVGTCPSILEDEFAFKASLSKGWNSLLAAVSCYSSIGLGFRISDMDFIPARLFYTLSDVVLLGQTTTATATIQSPGAYSLYLFVQDNDGNVGYDYKRIFASQPPQAIIESPHHEAQYGFDVIFHGKGIDDGTIILYEWDFDGDGSFEYSSYTSGSASNTFTSSGDYTASFRVTDNDGLSDEQSVTFTVRNIVPEILEITATPQKGIVPLYVELDATVTDPDGQIVSFQWDTDGDGVYESPILSSARWGANYKTSGLYNPTLKITDNHGGQTASSIEIEAKEEGAPDVAGNAAPNPGFTEQAIRFSAVASDIDGDIIRYEWDFDGDGIFDWHDTTQGEIASASSQYNDTTLSADNLIDGNVGSNAGWKSTYNPFPVEIVFSLPNANAYQIDQVCLNPYTIGGEKYWVKDFEILASNNTADSGDFVSVGNFILLQTGIEQFFDFVPVTAKYVKLIIYSSHSDQNYSELGEFKVLEEGTRDNLLCLDGTTYHEFNRSGIFESTVRAMDDSSLYDYDSLEIAVYPSGESASTVWVADSGNSDIVKLSSVGDELFRISAGYAYDIDIDFSDGSCWASISSNKIVKFSSEGQELFNVTGFYNPDGLSVDQSDGSCWVADKSNDQIVKLDKNGNELFRIGGLENPASVAADSNDGSCWVADVGNNRVLKLSENGEQLAAVSGFNNPYDVDVDPNDGSCWVADSYNHQIVKLAENVPDQYDVGNGTVITAEDDSPNENHGKLRKTSEFSQDGKLGNAARFDGQEAYIQIPHSTEYKPVERITVEFWANFQDLEKESFSVLSCNENGGWSFKKDGSEFFFDIYPLNESQSVKPGFDVHSLTTSQWHHIAGTYDGSEANLYLDGVLMDSIQASGNIKYYYSNSLIIGGEASYGDIPSSNLYFNGMIDEVRIWSVDHTLEQIEDSMNQELSGDEPGLIGYWKLDEQAGRFHKSIKAFERPKYIDVNSSDGTCWVSFETEKMVAHISSDCQIVLSSSGPFAYKGMRLGVNPVDGTCWAPVDSNTSGINKLFKLSQNGSELTELENYRNPKSVVVDPGYRNLSFPPEAQASADPDSGNSPLTVDFYGSATDSNGEIVSYEWDFEGDGEFDYISTENGDATFAYEGLAAIYSPVFRATDNDNLVDYVYLTIHVGELKVEASAEPVKGNVPLNVDFEGTAFSPDAHIVLYQWDYDGDGTFDWSGDMNEVSDHTFNQPGLYMAMFKATDSNGNSATASIPVTVNTEPPIAQAEVSPLEGPAPLHVSMVGESSYSDSGASIVSYEWDYDGDGVFDYYSESLANTYFIFHEKGVYYPTLKVTDNFGMTALDQKTVVPGNILPVATALASPIEGNAPLEVRFEGLGEDDDGDIILYEWSFGDYSFFEDDMESPGDEWTVQAPWARTNLEARGGSYCWTDSPEGDYSFNTDASLRAGPFDFSEAASPAFEFWHKYDIEEDFDFAYLEVSTDGSSWSVLKTFTGIQEDWKKESIDLAGFVGESNISFRFRIVTDSSFNRDGWYIDDVQIADKDLFEWYSTETGNVDHVFKNSGHYTATLRVADSSGDVSTDRIAIHVKPEGSPVAVAGASPISGSHPLEVAFSEAGSFDPDGTIVKHEWFFGENNILVESGGRISTDCNFIVDGVTVGTMEGGVNIVLLDENNLDVLTVDHFSTNNSSVESDRLAAFIDQLHEGAVVLAAIKGYGYNNLTEPAISSLESIASQYIRELDYDSSWAIIGTKGAETGSVFEDYDTEGGFVSLEGFVRVFSEYAPDSAIYTYQSPGLYPAALRVTDNDGKTDMDTIEIDVNLHPPVSLPTAMPLSGKAPLEVKFRTNGYDSDGTIEYFNWDFDAPDVSNQDYRVPDAPSSVVYQFPGVYHPSLTVVDNDSLSDQDALTIEVFENEGPESVEAFAQADTMFGRPPLTVRFSGHGSVENSLLKSFEWDFDGDGIFDWHSATTGAATYTYPGEGNYKAVFRVTDINGTSDTDEILIKVHSVGTPVAEASAIPSQGAAPLDVQFYGSAYDSDGSIVLYEWDFDGDGVFDWGDDASGNTTHTYEAPGTCEAMFKAADNEGNYDIIPFDIQVASGDVNAVRVPEAFDPSEGQAVTITTSLSLSTASFTLKIIDTSSEVVRTVVDSEPRQKGVYSDKWDGRNLNGIYASSGVYFFVIDYEANGSVYQFNPTSIASTGIKIAPEYSYDFSPVADKPLTGTFELDSPAELTVYVSKVETSINARVRTLWMRVPRPSGPQVVSWDGTMDNGAAVPTDSSYNLSVIKYKLSENAIILQNHPVVSNVNTNPDFFNIGNPYGVQDIEISYELSKQADIFAKIISEDGIIVKEITLYKVAAGKNTMAWNAKNNEGYFFNDGYYSVKIKARDDFGNESPAECGIFKLFF